VSLDASWPAMINSDDLVQTLNGAGTTSSLLTTYNGADGALSLVKRIRPRFATLPEAAQLELLAADGLADTPALVTTATFASNRFDVLSEARWHAFGLITTGGCELGAIDVDLRVVSEE
jgi:hypothetical protein